MTAADRSTDESSSNKKTVSHQETHNVAPDGGYGWVVLAASFFISFILDGIMYSFGIILKEIKLEKANEAAEDVINLLSSFNTGFLFCSGPIVAGLANQFGCRSVVMGGGIVTALMYILTVFSPNIYMMIFFYGFVGGISTGCTYIASLIIIAEYFDKKRGIATGITMAGSGVGSFVFAPLIGIMIEKKDWQFTMSICSCIILQTAVCGALLKPLNSSSSKKSKQVELRSLSEQQHKGDMALDDDHFEKGKVIQTYLGSVYSLNKQEDEDLPFHQRNTCLKIVVEILKEMTDFKLLIQNFGFLLITISNFFLFTGYFSPFLYITEISENNGVSATMASYLISVIGIVNIPSRMLYGFIADRRVISAINLNTFSVTVATVPLFLFFILQKAYWSQIIFSIAFAIGIAGMNCLTTMYLCDLVGLKKFGNATGIINLFRGFGCFLGPYLSGLIKTRLNVDATFFYSGICFLVGLVFTVLVSFGSMIKACLNKQNNNNTTNETTVRTADDSEINKNLLTKA